MQLSISWAQSDHKAPESPNTGGLHGPQRRTLTKTIGLDWLRVSSTLWFPTEMPQSASSFNYIPKNHVTATNEGRNHVFQGFRKKWHWILVYGHVCARLCICVHVCILVLAHGSHTLTSGIFLRCLLFLILWESLTLPSAAPPRLFLSSSARQEHTGFWRVLEMKLLTNWAIL